MLRTLLIASLIFAASACRREEAPAPPPAAPPATTAPAPGAPPVSSATAPFRVASIDLGSAVGADKRVTASTSTFTPTDKIYASVASEGSAASVVLSARWTYEDGQLVHEETETIAPSGPAVTEFHIEKPSGWPAGKYKVEIASNGQPAGSKEFEVR
jgi:hypothetical protein